MLGMPVLSFSSDLWRKREEEKGRETDRQTERGEHFPAHREKREWVKGVTAAPYQKNKENELSRKNGSMNSLHAKKQQTADVLKSY